MRRTASGRDAAPLLSLVALLPLAVAFHASSLLGQVADTDPAADSLQVADSLRPDSLGADSLGTPYDAPLPEQSAAHLDHITTAFAQAPGGMGLIPTGMAEAEITAEHVRLADRDSTNLSSMTRHMAHVLHAIDPNEVGQGPGMGYGFKRAAEGVLTHLRLATAEPDIPGVLVFHAPYVERATREALARADDAIRVARRVQRASSAREAHRLVRELDYLVRAMTYGDDRDDDGRIGHTEAESGLAQASYHLRLVRRVTDPLPQR